MAALHRVRYPGYPAAGAGGGVRCPVQVLVCCQSGCCSLPVRLEGLEPGLAAERAEAVFAQIDTNQVSSAAVRWWAVRDRTET